MSLARHVPLVLVSLVSLGLIAAPTGEDARLLRNPAVSAQHIAFVYANDIWIVDKAGGDARRLTTFAGNESEPHFSPDGSSVAFSGQYDGNTDVYVVSIDGGDPQRLTWHPSTDMVRGWSPDGSRIIFASGRASAPVGYAKFWSIPLAGGSAEPLPIPRAWRGSFSPDGRRMAYQMISLSDVEWRNYRGGQTNPIRLIDLRTYDVVKLPWEGSNDLDPVWLGDHVFFLSDRDRTMNVYAYNVSTGALQQRTHYTQFDVKNLAGGPGGLVFEMGGYLYALEPSGGEARKLTINVRGDFSWARPHWTAVNTQIRSWSLSPSGKRGVFEARGDIFTVPAKEGDVRNLTHTAGVAERSPAWSPDGQYISYFSDASGEYQLVIADQFGNNARSIALANPTFFYTPAWSPDSKHVSFGDADRNLWVADVESSRVRRIDNEAFAHPERIIYPEWSPDSKWVTYSKRLRSQFAAVFVYSLETGETHQITDGMSNSWEPVWDKGGKYIYFLSSTNYGLNIGWLDMTSFNMPVTSAIYLAVLSADEPNPFKPKSDDEEVKKAGEEEREEEKGEEKPAAGGAKAAPVVRIDFANLDQRIVALEGVPPRQYTDLEAGAKDVLFYAEDIENEPGVTIRRYSLEDREGEAFLPGINGFLVSADGKKLLYSSSGNTYGIVETTGSHKPGDGRIGTNDMRMRVDPEAEWQQIFNEAVRYQRDYFYVDNVHGLDLSWVKGTYGPWVEHVRHRNDLTYILDILGGETSIGHSFTGGGDWPDIETVPVGLLGADFTVANGRYRIQKIYRGENWNPTLRAPLSGPGIDVNEGDYLIAVDGVELTAAMNPYSVFDRTANKQTVLTLNNDPSRDGARDVVVVPVASEGALRQRDWMQHNRHVVDSLSNGRVAYVWLPNTSFGGYTNFNRYFFAQQDKQAAVMDERWNSGGSIADYMIDYMSRDLLGYFNNPVGDHQPFTAPNAAIWGPKVMIINDAAGSGGDMLPYMFRFKKLGPLVGTRTWGGLVGIWDVPPLIDGGGITAPRGGFYNVEGEWDVEGKGVSPDIEVEMDPKLVNAGRDPQLERAVAAALELLKTQAVQLLPEPPAPVRVESNRRRKP
ncbi:MAG TPA: PDZ domain-containing protein [Gemmatimonadales bacterium]|jgi:tricorn protease